MTTLLQIYSNPFLLNTDEIDIHFLFRLSIGFVGKEQETNRIKQNMKCPIGCSYNLQYGVLPDKINTA